MADKILVTSALPYANGPIHLGHVLEYVQTDIFVRFLRSCGNDVVYLCAEDTHGTPIEINAAKQGLKPEEFVARFFQEHKRDFRDFDIGLDFFWSTHSPENQKYSDLIYERLKAAGDIERREIEQYYCETDKRFLPDRLIRGTCPNCGTPDQYGDVCENCGKTYSPTDLINPRCAICGSPPVCKKSSHLFFRLSRHQDFLLRLIREPGFLHPAVSNQLQQFFQKGLADWDISRDGPYFGFRIPGETDKFFYVWFDAPIGYIAATERWAKETGKAKDALDYWAKDAKAQIVHVIGKDIVYFHGLFWPAVLSAAGLKRPSRLIVHGHLTVNGEKMSKTRGTFINARQYLDRLDPNYLRFFYAANLGSGPEDMDLSLAEFRNRVNADLVNNIGNLANRSLSLLAGPLHKKLAPASDGEGRELVESGLRRAQEVRAAFEKLEFRAAVKGIVEISQAANQFLQAHAPWSSVKVEPEIARRDLSDAADVVYLVAGLLEPVVPALSEKLFSQLGAPHLSYQALASLRYPLLDRQRPIGSPAPLIARLEESQVNAILSPTLAEASATQTSSGAGSGSVAEIDYPDFAKLNLKAGKILAAEPVAKADKVLKLTVDLGETSPRTIVAGIAEAYRPEQVIGRNVVVVANLKPKTVRGIRSQGMLLVAGSGGSELSLVDPGAVKPGTEVK